MSTLSLCTTDTSEDIITLPTDHGRNGMTVMRMLLICLLLLKFYLTLQRILLALYLTLHLQSMWRLFHLAPPHPIFFLQRMSSPFLGQPEVILPLGNVLPRGPGHLLVYTVMLRSHTLRQEFHWPAIVW